MKTVHTYTSEMNKYLIHSNDIDETVNFKSLFQNENPVEIEIGMGKGRFLLAESGKRLETNFIGIEKQLKWLRLALFRITRAARTNCRLLCIDADFMVKLLIAPQSVAAYHVYFPDPWPKKAQKKRRLFNPRFLEKMAETLVPGGVLYLKTDHAEYYEDTIHEIENSALFALLDQSIYQPKLSHFEEASDSATHYEIKWALESRLVYSAVFKKI